MTIQSPENNGINLSAGVSQQQTTPGYGGTTTQTPDGQQQNPSIAAIFNAFGSSSRSSSSDAEVQKVSVLFREWLEKNPQVAYEVVTVSNQQTGNYGAVVLCAKQVIGSTTTIIAHVAMVEKSKQTEQQAQQINYGAQNIEVFVGVGDAYTPSYVGKIADAVRRHYGEGVSVVNGGWSVVYKETPLDADGFQPFINECLVAIDYTKQSSLRDKPQFDLGMLQGQNPIRLRSHIALDQYQTSPGGLPIRSDITSELVMVQTGNNKNGVDESAELLVCKTSAYVDLIYVPPQTNSFFGVMPQQAITPSYIPRINITNFAMELPVSSLEFMMLGIASIAALAKNRSYGIVWRDNFGSAANAKRNLGAVGIQVQGLSVDGQAGILDVNGDVRKLYALMQTVLAENPVFTIELMQGGQSNWLTTIIARIAGGDIKSQEVFIAACDTLTRNKFSPIYQQLCQQAGGVLQPIVTTSDEPSLAGTYKADGELRDLRELDLLAVLNLIGTKDPELVMGYLSTYSPYESIQVRLDRRARILKSLAKDVQLRAYSRKYDFGGLFIQALTQAIAANQVVIGNDNFLNQQEAVYSQTFNQWQGAMVNSAALNGLFQQQPIAMQNGGWTVGNIYGSGF